MFRVLAMSGGGSLASCRSAISLSLSTIVRHAVSRRAIFQEVILSGFMIALISLAGLH
jgi:hypothetical protein